MTVSELSEVSGCPLSLLHYSLRLMSSWKSHVEFEFSIMLVGGLVLMLRR
jgi:hypothetical protein